MLFVPILSILFALNIQADAENRGLQALDKGDYAQAEQIFSGLVSQDPKDYGALFNLALAETGLKKNDEAEEHYRKVLSLKPGLYEAELNLGILELRNKHAADALPLLQDAAKQKPSAAPPRRYLADAYLATGDAAAAEEQYKQAVAANSKLAAAELGLGQSLERQGKLDEALPHFRRASELDPTLKSYELELAVSLSKANRADDAIAILKDFPKDAGACEELGRLYLATNRPADAVNAFQQAVAISSTPANRLALATAYLKNNQPDLAEPILQAALAANPEDYDLHMAVGRIQRDKHQYPAAANQFVEAARIKPESVEAWNEAATAYVLAEQYPQALAALDKVHNLGAENAGDFYFRAIVLDKLHQVKPALASYQHFLAVSGGKFPDQEFIARQRSKILEKEANR